MSEYRVQLDVFTGPLDLLLFLIKRDEVDIYDIPIVRVTEQYLDHVKLLEALDPNAVSEFLVLAATLIELKSRALLPTPPLEDGTEIEDPRAPLVKQLLEYKRFKDAARALGRAADDRAARYVRRPAELPRELQGVELEEAQVWDLLGAFNRVMTAIGRGPGEHQVRYDDTPIELHQAEIVALLEQDGPLTFQAVFSRPESRIHIVGRFLALLELIRGRRIRAEQEKTFGTIYLFLLEELEAPEESQATEDLEAREFAGLDEPAEPETAEYDSGPEQCEPEPEDWGTNLQNCRTEPQDCGTGLQPVSSSETGFQPVSPGSASPAAQPSDAPPAPPAVPEDRVNHDPVPPARFNGQSHP